MSFLCAFVLSAPLLMFTILHFQFYILHSKLPLCLRSNLLSIPKLVDMQKIVI